MLIHLTDIKGRHYWVNPVHVKLLQQGRHGVTEVVLTWGGGFASNLSIKVDRPIDEIAAQLNAAMPAAMLDYVPDDETPPGGDFGVAAGIMTT